MADILNEIIAIGGSTAHETPVTAQDLAGWFLGDDAYCCFVAVDDASDIAGFQGLEISDAYGADIGDISTFARQTPKTPGIGTALFKATLEGARTANLTALNAKIRADNVSGLAYYTKMGFQDHRVIPGVPLSDGTPVDRVLKRYQLA
jgi:L-amino acid N-acyltransferase YncA